MGKVKQWSIDRAFHLNEINEPRLRAVLEAIYQIENNKVSKEDAMNQLISKGFIVSVERYEQSTQTLLNNMGFIYESYVLSETAVNYLEGKINFQELMLLQLFKKEYKIETTTTVRPLLCLLDILYRLTLVDHDNAWVDTFDYFEFLINISDYDEIPTVVNEILKARTENIPRSKYTDKKDFDMWVDAFVSSGLFQNSNKGYSYSICLNEDKLSFIQFLISLEKETTNVDFNIRSLESKKIYGSIKNGIFDHIPPLKLSSFQFKNVNLVVNEKLLIESYLFEKISLRNLENKLGINDRDGWVAKNILNKYGIDTSGCNAGIYERFKDYKFLIKNNYKFSSNNNYQKIFDVLFENYGIKEKNMSEKKIIGENKIFTGIPGCGKSYTVKKLLKEKEIGKDRIFRTTFYLDYSNSDFIGQILPYVDENGHAKYKYVPGPFTEALECALKHPFEEVYLIIEEINRGNAAAIFGDTFQLLDRAKRNNIDGIKEGESEYPIRNSFIENYFKQKRDTNLILDGQIVIPSNMFIYATMNTSDQNVFPLDTAFKRRWNIERVVANWKDCDFAPKNIPGTDITWESFAATVNKKMCDESKDGLILEDKQLGPWFVDGEIFESGKLNPGVAIELFVDKVIDYIWTDVAKFDKNNWFKGDLNDFNELRKEIRKYVDSEYEGVKDFKLNVVEFIKPKDE